MKETLKVLHLVFFGTWEYFLLPISLAQCAPARTISEGDQST